jgi:ATP-dependent Lon protease
MQESAQAALSYVRSASARYSIEDEYWSEHDIHLHVPTGAQPKDGPSAGVTMAVALTSLATGRPVRSEVGMTGEVTLRGKILPIGGVKEKILAAHRAGLKTVMLPKRNEIDLEDVPDEVRKDIEFVFIDTIDEAIETALKPKKKRKSRSASQNKGARSTKSKTNEKSSKGKSS